MGNRKKDSSNRPFNIWNGKDFSISGFGKKHCIIGIIRHFFNCLKWSGQRINRGYADCDVWDMYSYLQTMSGQIYQPVEIYDMTPLEAKAEMRKYTGGDTQDYELVRFSFRGKNFPLEPKDFFYNWLYIRALNCNPEMMSELIEYDAFTDIEFNPERQFNCQAIACAIYVGLTRSGQLDEAVKSPEDFLRVVYGGVIPC